VRERLSLFVNTSSLISLTCSKCPGVPILGFDFSLPKNVPVPSVRKLQQLYSPICPAPALNIAFATLLACSVGTKTTILKFFSLLSIISIGLRFSRLIVSASISDVPPSITGG